MQAGDYSGYLTGRAHDEQEAWHEQRGDYYTGPADGAPDASGLWRGDPSALAALGVGQDLVVERQALARALRGQRADSGEQLRRPGANGVVNSHDLTMGVPKSVSVLWAQSNPERRAAIEQAAREAAEATVRYMALTTECVQRRADSGERVWEPARGVAGAYFVHHTARRASAADVPDPHLHVHCVVVGVERSDGRLVTPNQAAWVRHGREGGAYFRAELATQLLELGLEIETGTGKQGRFFELAGVSREVCERLSGRTQEVEAARAEFVRLYGRLPVEGELADLAIKSRERKGPETVAEIEPYWRAVAAEHGFDTAAAERLWGRSIEQDREPIRERVGAELVRRIERQGATVRSREARAMAYELSAGQLTPPEAMQLVADLQERGLVIALSDDRVTTRTTRAQEYYCLDVAKNARPGAGVSFAALERGLEAGDRASGAFMSVEQVPAVQVLCGDARIAGLVGRAGTGKGVVIRAASEAYRLDGWQVLVCATQGARAQGLGSQAAGDVMTINQLTHRVSTGRLAVGDRTLIFVDEAGMVDTHRMAQLMHLCHQHGCSLRLVGDPAQLSAIGPGGLFERLLALENVPAAELVEIHRTPHQWLRDYQNLVREGNAAAALTMLREHDCAHMLDTRADAMQRMVDDWNRWRHEYAPGDALMVVHTTNNDVDAVNMLAQAKRREAGELGIESVKAPDRTYELHVGDRVMFRETAYRFDDPDEQRVENGTRGTIEHIDVEHNRVSVRLEEPGHETRSVEIDLERSAALRLDYASHVYPAQGDTRSRTAELTGGPMLSRESAYVGGSRLREHHELYTSREALGTDGTDHDRWQRLAEQMNESRAQVPSIAYAQDYARQIAARVPEPARDALTVQVAEVQRSLNDATRQRDELRHRYPDHVEHQIERTKELAAEKAKYARQAGERIGRAIEQERQLKAWQRSERKQLQEQIFKDTQHRAELSRASRELIQRAHEMTVGPGGPEAWKREHGADLAQREQRVQELTADRDRLREQALERTLREPPRYLTRMLGERPNEPEPRKVWDEAAHAVEAYREEHSVHDRHTALGPEPVGDFQRRLAFDRTKNEVTRARDDLGLANRQHQFAPDRVPGLAVELPSHGRGIDRSL